MKPLSATRFCVSMVSVCGRAVASVRQVVDGSLSTALPASVPLGELSAVTLQPVRGSGPTALTATGTARGMTCAACGSRAATGKSASRCSSTAAPVQTHMIKVAPARDHSLVFTSAPRSGPH